MKTSIAQRSLDSAVATTALHLGKTALLAILVIAVCLISSTPGRAQIPGDAQLFDYPFDESNDNTIQSVGSLITPASYDPNGDTLWPLVVFYHGYGEWGTNYEHLTKNVGNLLTRACNTNAPGGGFLVYAPQAPTQGWNSSKLEVTMRMVAKIMLEHKVDPERVYVTGLSNGGGATWLISSQYFDIFAAAVPICSANLGGTTGWKDEHIWAFHARNDSQSGASVNNTRGKVNAVRAEYGLPAFTAWPSGTATWDYEAQGSNAADTPKLKYREYGTGGHAIWGTVYGYEPMYSWLLDKTNIPTTLEVGETILFDFGSTALATAQDSQGRYWNSVSGGTTQKTRLPFKPFARVSETGARKFVIAEIVTPFSGGTTTGGVATGDIRYDADINKDSWITGNLSETGTIRISGLVPGATYELTCFASAGTVSNGWTTTYIAATQAADLVVGNNAANTAVLADVIAAADGTIDLGVKAKAPASKGFIGALEIRRTVPPVSSIYQQSFESGPVLNDYFSDSPTESQLNDITPDWAISDGRLQQTRSTSSVHTGFTRLQQPGSTPGIVVTEFDVIVTGATNFSDIAILDLGPQSAFVPYGGSIPNTGVANRLTIRGAGSGAIRFQVNGLYGTGLPTPTFANGTTWRVVWVTNLTGSSVTYEAPDGSTQSVPMDACDLWIRDAATGAYALVFEDMPKNPAHTANTMGGFRLRSVSTAPITLALDNIEVYPLD